MLYSIPTTSQRADPNKIRSFRHGRTFKPAVILLTRNVEADNGTTQRNHVGPRTFLDKFPSHHDLHNLKVDGGGK